MSANIEVYFLHGWGFDSAIWNDWLFCVNQNVITYVFDRGYFKNKKQNFELNFSARSKIVIAHSFGLHYLSAKDFSQINTLILISSFCYFHEYAANPKLSYKQIDLMKQKLVNDPAGVLCNFYSRCGLKEYSVNPPLINTQLLYDDLIELNRHQVDRASVKSIPNVILLHGVQDNIVIKDHSNGLHDVLLNSSVFISESEGHALPLTNPDWCINMIESGLNKKIFDKHKDL